MVRSAVARPKPGVGQSDSTCIVHPVSVDESPLSTVRQIESLPLEWLIPYLFLFEVILHGQEIVSRSM